MGRNVQVAMWRCGGPCDFSVSPDCFGFMIGIGSKGTGLGTIIMVLVNASPLKPAELSPNHDKT